jgi:homoserine O-acetyltransferase
MKFFKATAALAFALTSMAAAAADYDAAPDLSFIHASLPAIYAADDERNPAETGVIERALKQVKNGKLYLIPASDQTNGHLTIGNAKFYKQKLLQTAPLRAM